MLFHTDFVDSQGGFAFSGGPILFLQKEGDNNWMESFKKGQLLADMLALSKELQVFMTFQYCQLKTYVAISFP